MCLVCCSCLVFLFFFGVPESSSCSMLLAGSSVVIRVLVSAAAAAAENRVIFPSGRSSAIGEESRAGKWTAFAGAWKCVRGASLRSAWYFAWTACVYLRDARRTPPPSRVGRRGQLQKFAWSCPRQLAQCACLVHVPCALSLNPMYLSSLLRRLGKSQHLVHWSVERGLSHFDAYDESPNRVHRPFVRLRNDTIQVMQPDNPSSCRPGWAGWPPACLSKRLFQDHLHRGGGPRIEEVDFAACVGDSIGYPFGSHISSRALYAGEPATVPVT